MLLSLIVSLVQIKLKSNNFNLCSGNMNITFIQKQYDCKTLLFSKTNYLVGSNLNRDQNYSQNNKEMLLNKDEIRKETVTVLAAQKYFRPRSGRSAPAWARGPTADGRAANLARRGASPSPSWAESQPNQHRSDLGHPSRSNGWAIFLEEQNGRRPVPPKP